MGDGAKGWAAAATPRTSWATLPYLITTPPPAEGASPRPFVGVEPSYLKRWHVIVTAGWAIALAASSSISVRVWGQYLAVGLHLLGLAVTLGAVFLVDWHGLVWLSGLQTFRETLRVGEAAHTLVWFGLLLLISGAGRRLPPCAGWSAGPSSLPRPVRTASQIPCRATGSSPMVRSSTRRKTKHRR